jgi:hypothetical protein
MPVEVEDYIFLVGILRFPATCRGLNVMATAGHLALGAAPVRR